MLHAEIIIIGAGVAGAGAAWHLSKAGANGVLVLEGGSVGVGDEGRRSGTAVMPPPANTIKMAIQLYASSSADYIQHHGIDGARKYLQLAARGVELIKEIGPKVLPAPKEQLRCLGSLYVADESDVEGLEEEYRTLVSLGCKGLELWGKEKVAAVQGARAGFVRGIYFPDDAILDSSAYARALLADACANGAVSLRERCRVTSVREDEGSVVVEVEGGGEVRGGHVVVCTGGLWLDESVCGVLKPCWSYLTSLKVEQSLSEMPYPNSMNFFTWGFTHDWCVTNGHIRVSGEDHFSALKPSKVEERCRNMAEWCAGKYESVLASAKKPFGTQCGIYSETPDHAPLFGKPRKDSRIVYLLGCNAWGQAVMSFGASLVPGMLGYKALSEEEQSLLDAVSISRFAHLPAVARGGGAGGARAKL